MKRHINAMVSIRPFSFYYKLFLIIGLVLFAQDSAIAELFNEPIRPIPKLEISNPELVKLGEKLFHDPLLSKDGSISCSSCHSLSAGGTDGLVVSVGVDKQAGVINSPTVFNVSLNISQFWDGRATDLMEQVDGPIKNLREMAANWPDIVVLLKQDSNYRKQFQRLFSDGITSRNIKSAIVAFEETLLTPDSRFDRYLRGEQNVITEDELAGYTLFKEFGCFSCHQGMNVGGNLYQKLGVIQDYFVDKNAITRADLGRFNVTGRERDRFVFKVPSLRNVELTAPYLHNGASQTLGATIQKMLFYQLGVDMKSRDVHKMIAFLKTLTGTYQGDPL